MDNFCEDSYRLGLADAFSSIDKRPATVKQKDFTSKLGLKIKEGLTLKEAQIRISAVLEAKEFFVGNDDFSQENYNWDDF